MKNFIDFQCIIYWFTFLIISMTFGQCYQNSTNKGFNTSQETGLIESKEIKNGINNKLNEPAVIYKSTDLGMTWMPFAKGIPQDATLSGIKQYGNEVYITTDYHGVFVISNTQDTWTSLIVDTLNMFDINCIEVEKKNLVIGTFKHGIIRSTNGGQTWNKAKQNIINTPIRAFIKFENKLYAGTDSGIYESADMGNTWAHIFGEMQILGFTSLNDKIYAAAHNGAILCEGNPDNWEYIYNGDALHDISNDGKYIYAMTINQQLLKTKNDGVSWENAQNGIFRPPNYYTNEIQYVGNNIFSAQWIGIYHSLDNGTNWSILNGLPDSTAFSTLEITDIGIIAGISIR